MSAFVVSHDHIDALLTFAKDKHMQSQLGYFVDPVAANPCDWTTIGRVLLAENERSVCTRYPDCVPGDCLGKIGEEAIGYRFRRFEPFMHMAHNKKCVWIIKGCQCLDYQSCETDDWEQSIAWRIVNAIQDKAISSMLEYSDAPWEIIRDRKAA